MPRVTGTIRIESGVVAAPPITVCAFDIDFRSEQRLGEALLSAPGVYTITYREEQFARAEQKRVSVSHIARPRTLLYAALWSLIGIGMLLGLATRGTLALSVLHDRAPLFVTLSDGGVRNGYTLKIASKAHEERTLTLRIGISSAGQQR